MIARFVVMCVVLSAGGLCAGDDTKGEKKDDKDQLQGEWVVVKAEVAGKELASLKDKKLVVKGDEWTAPTGRELTFKFKLDAAKNPKQIDLKLDAGGAEMTLPGIYKIEGDTLTY